MNAMTLALLVAFGLSTGAGTVCARRRAPVAAAVLLALGTACFSAAFVDHNQDMQQGAAEHRSMIALR